MNDAWGYGDPNEGQASTQFDGPKALREAYDAQKKLIEDMRADMERDRAERKQEKLASVFTNLGVPGAAALYQGEPDPEKAAEWVNTMKATFGNGNVQGEVTQAPVQPALAADQQEQYQRMSEAGQNGVPMGNFEAASAAVGQATDIESLIASFANAARLNG